jgi:hypothetical protein
MKLNRRNEVDFTDLSLGKLFSAHRSESYNSANSFTTTGTGPMSVGGSSGCWPPVDITPGLGPTLPPNGIGNATPPAYFGNNWTLNSVKTAPSDFFRIQYADVEMICAYTGKPIPAGAPFMCLLGRIISAEAIEKMLFDALFGDPHAAMYGSGDDSYETEE